MREPPGPTGPYLEVNLHSLAQAGTFLETLGSGLATDVQTVRRAAIDALGAIPPSDLYSAYAFCWGRWSSVLEDAHTAITQAGTATKTAAGTLKTIDDHQGPPRGTGK